ncbi:unnamed protein product [Ectocarpus sp. CCAP 1310/34]|nr:unnamed protein product [Ectocarpus sp. CCAP 1310/34]
MDDDSSLPLILGGVIAVAMAILNHQQLLAFCHHESLQDGSLLFADATEEPSAKRKRTVYPRPDYHNSAWAIMLREKEDALADPTTKDARLFRRRFRMPYPIFLELVKEIKSAGWKGFTTDATDLGGRGTRPCIPVELKVLGRGNFFDDIPQLSFISEQTIQRVFHEFTQRFALEFFPKHVKFPQGAHLEEILREYKDVGFGGCAGSMDCTHIHYQSAPNSGRHSYVGKEGFATVAFEVVCDHKLRCLGVSKAFPGAMNDKTIVMFDEYVRRIKTECKDVPFTLLGEDGSEFEERGLYLIVDGGYHKWRCLQCPVQFPVTQDELAFRKQLESVRKDIECFFGILKGRFRILKMPLLYRGIHKLDCIFQTCCALHNMLHSYDGLSLLEKDCEWAGADGDLDPWVTTPEA